MDKSEKASDSIRDQPRPIDLRMRLGPPHPSIKGLWSSSLMWLCTLARETWSSVHSILLLPSLSSIKLLSLSLNLIREHSVQFNPFYFKDTDLRDPPPPPFQFVLCSPRGNRVNWISAVTNLIRPPFRGWEMVGGWYCGRLFHMEWEVRFGTDSKISR